MKQTMTQKARGVGTITLTIQRPHGREMVSIDDVRNFREGQQALNNAAHEGRTKAKQFQASLDNTHRAETINIHRVEGSREFKHPEMPTLIAAPEIRPVDPIERLRRLGELRDAEILTAEEFDATKAEILARM